MMRWVSTVICTAGLVLVAAAGGSERAAAETLNVYNWNDYIAEDTLDRFTEETGIAVNYDVFDSLELLEQKLLVGRSGYDIIVPTARPTLARLIQAGAVQPLDKSKIPNLANLDTALMQRVADADPGNQHAAIYLWGTIGIGVIPEKITALMPDAPLDSFDLLFDPAVTSRIAPCGLTLLDSAIDSFPTVFHYLGLHPDSMEPADLMAVQDRLMAVRPHLKTFVTGAVINNLAGGDTCAALAYSGDVLQASQRAAEAGSPFTVEYVIPKEGVQVWFDVLAIPSDAPNPDAAHRFIDFVLRPDIMADISNYVQYGNAVPDSLPMVDPEIRDDPAVFPSAEAIDGMFTVSELPPAAARQRTRVWTRVKTGY